MTHTQGTWTFSPWYSENRFTIMGPDERAIFVVGGCRSYQEIEADVRLIAAAPEMLELLEGIQLYPDVRQHIAAKFPGLVEKIKAVCDKAKGTT